MNEENEAQILVQGQTQINKFKHTFLIHTHKCIVYIICFIYIIWHKFYVYMKPILTKAQSLLKSLSL